MPLIFLNSRKKRWKLMRAMVSLGSDSSSSDLDQLLGPDWEGWPFGRDLYVSEIYSLIQKVPGVKHVLDVRLSYRPVIPAKERAAGSRSAPERVEEKGGLVGTAVAAQSEAGDETPSAEEALTKVDQRVIPIPADGLCCSLDHDIRIVEL